MLTGLKQPGMASAVSHGRELDVADVSVVLLGRLQDLQASLLLVHIHLQFHCCLSPSLLLLLLLPAGV